MFSKNSFIELSFNAIMRNGESIKKNFIYFSKIIIKMILLEIEKNH